VPIFSHWSLNLALLTIFIFGIFEPSLILLAFLFWLIMLVHELGHMFVASRLNLDTQKIELYLFHGFCYYEFSEENYENYIVAWGGVAAQAVIFVPCILVHQIFGSYLSGLAMLVIIFLGYFSAFIALLNLIPSRGLDGATCWKAIPIYLKERKRKKSSKAKKKFRVIK
jgi:membrane-associated protease RseP (regulator of RpoE activity)